MTILVTIITFSSSEAVLTNVTICFTDVATLSMVSRGEPEAHGAWRCCCADFGRTGACSLSLHYSQLGLVGLLGLRMLLGLLSLLWVLRLLGLLGLLWVLRLLRLLGLLGLLWVLRLLRLPGLLGLLWVLRLLRLLGLWVPSPCWPLRGSLRTAAA